MQTKLAFLLLFFLLSSVGTQAQEPKQTEDWSKKPDIVTPGKKFRAPSDALILYRSKKDLAKWQTQNGSEAQWDATMCGMTVNRTGAIFTKQPFGDCQLHIEWRTPRKVVGDGQGRGNSGIYFMGKYEVQILDSYENETYYNGQAGSIYKQSAPLVNASRKPGKWQSYDVIFHDPRFKADGSLDSPATFTVFHNGVLIQDHYILKGPSVFAGYPKYTAHEEKLPMMLQDHGNPVKYRNIWIREL